MRAAIVTVGSELTEGLRIDTNTAEIARALAPRGFRVSIAASVGDDVTRLAELLANLCADHDLVVTTGGLGPTHDDITREAASRALGRPLVRDRRLTTLLEPVIARHKDPEAASQVLNQADVIEGAEVIDPTTGTAPGLVVPAPAGFLALLPGPPSEMRPMLAAVAGRYPMSRAEPHDLGVVGLTESDAQVRAQRALEPYGGVALTVLARPGDVRVLLLDDGAGSEVLAAASSDVARALGDHCYSEDGASIEEVVVREAARRGVMLACAESCTGGLVGAALTEVAGASACFLGSVVTYSDAAKSDLLGVKPDALNQHGAVSEQVARQMAEGARTVLGADTAVAVTGIAGPDGGSADKPVGLVWFALASDCGTEAVDRRFSASSRTAVRARATATALDLLRREVLRR